jgi:circadian clock protein KaiB
MAEVLNEAREKYVRRSLIAGTTLGSQTAIRNMNEICHEDLNGRYRPPISNIYQQPTLAKVEQTVADPTLINDRPLPGRLLVEDLSNKERVPKGLDKRTPNEREGQVTK